MKVVLGVDGSPASMKAVKWVASAGDIERVLVVAAADSGIAMRDSKIVQIVREAAESNVLEATRALSALTSKVSGRVVDGDAREALVDAAQAEDADLLVVGSRGRTGIGRLLLGSVASHVAEHAPCSVLIVRERQRGME